MALELVRDTIRFDQVVGEGQGQTLLDRDVIVPDIKPDIARILSIEGKVNITSKEIGQDRIAVDGTVNFVILYSANDEPQPIYSMGHSDSFSLYMDVLGALPKMEAEIKCDFEHIDFNRINGRKFNIKCVLNLKGKVKDRIPIDAVRDVSGIADIQLLKDTVVTDELIGDNTAQTVVRGAIEVPDIMPQVDEIIKYSASIHKKDVSVEDGKLVISGCALVPILFSGKSDENVDIFRVAEDMIFTHTMDMPGIMPDMACNVDYSIDDIYTELKEDENGDKRHIDIEVVVGLKAQVTQKNEFPIIVDMYAPSARIEPGKMDVMADLFFGRNSELSVVKENVQLPASHPEMEKVYDVVCKPAVTDCKIEEDKIVIDGVVGFDIIYLARGEERLVHSFSDEIPFRSFVTVPGCKGDMKPAVDVYIENMDFVMLTKNELEIKLGLSCLATVYEKISKGFIIKAEEVEGLIPIHKSSITIYMVQQGDTLWKIAKRYYTTMENIISINELADADSLMPGMKLIIPKRM